MREYIARLIYTIYRNNHLATIIKFRGSYYNNFWYSVINNTTDYINFFQ